MELLWFSLSLTAGLSGTFSNLLIPLQIGARDMASGLLNMISYWLFFISSVIMVISLFVEAGPAAAGWTIYPPLECFASSTTRIRIRNDTLASLNGNFYCFLTFGVTKLYCYRIELKDKRYDHESFTLNDMGIFCYCNYWGCFFSSFIICSTFVDYG